MRDRAGISKVEQADISPEELEILVEFFRTLSKWKRELMAKTPGTTVSNPKQMAKLAVAQ